MSSFIDALWKWPIATGIRSPKNDDEHADRLNHRVTVGLILMGTLIVSTSSFVFNRISCWLPTELKHGSYTKYIEHHCWISNTYYVHTNVEPPQSDHERREVQIGE
jgi:hypothetical protein